MLPPGDYLKDVNRVEILRTDSNSYVSAAEYYLSIMSSIILAIY